MDKRKQIQIVSLMSAALVLSGVVLDRISDNREKNRIYEDIVIEDTIKDEPEEEPIRYQFHYYNDTVDVESEISKLGITNNDSNPYNVYKFIRFVDYDSREKYAIVNGYVDYEFDDENNVLNTIYTYVDIFTGKVMFTTSDYKEIKEYNSDVVWYLMEYGDLLGLRESVISKGLDEEYARSVMGDDVKNKSLTASDVARYYVLLVNSANRIESTYTMSIG